MSQTIEQVKQKYEMEWIKIPGVEGVGISEDKGEESIIVYVSSNEIKDKLPAKVAGFRVKFQHTGKFQAYKL